MHTSEPTSGSRIFSCLYYNCLYTGCHNAFVGFGLLPRCTQPVMRAHTSLFLWRRNTADHDCAHLGQVRKSPAKTCSPTSASSFPKYRLRERRQYRHKPREHLTMPSLSLAARSWRGTYRDSFASNKFEYLCRVVFLLSWVPRANCLVARCAFRLNVEMRRCRRGVRRFRPIDQRGGGRGRSPQLRSATKKKSTEMIFGICALH